jgi:hypothetical protein
VGSELCHYLSGHMVYVEFGQEIFNTFPKQHQRVIKVRDNLSFRPTDINVFLNQRRKQLIKID